MKELQQLFANHTSARNAEYQSITITITITISVCITISLSISEFGKLWRAVTPISYYDRKSKIFVREAAKGVYRSNEERRDRTSTKRRYRTDKVWL
jgi:hypothetical protein